LPHSFTVKPILFPYLKASILFLKTCLPSNPGYYSAFPRDPTEPSRKKISLRRTFEEVNGIEIPVTRLREPFTTEVIGFKYPKILWYKPAKDKLVMVKQRNGKSICQQGEQTTFLMCATSDNVAIKFALELKDDPPKGPEKVEFIKNEKNRDDKLDKIIQALPPGPLLLTVATPLIMNVISGPEPAGGYIEVELPKTEEGKPSDLKGFEIYCGIGTPVGDLSASKAMGVVTFDSPDLDDKSGRLGKIKDSVEVDRGEMNELLGEFELENNENVCEYVKITFDGRQVFRKRIDAFKYGNKIGFTVNECGNNALELLPQITSIPYCYTLVPIDSQGNRNPDEAATTCTSFSSLLDRYLEDLGIKDLYEPYIAVKDETRTAMNAISSGNYDELFKLVKGIEPYQKFQTAKKAMQEKYMTDTVKDAMVIARDSNKALAQAMQEITEQEKSNIMRKMIEERRLPPEVEQKAWEYMGNELGRDEKEKILGKTIDNMEKYDDRTKDKMAEILRKKKLSLDYKLKAKALEDARVESSETDTEMVKLEAQNSDGKLTREQIEKLYEEILMKKHGLSAQKILFKKSCKYLSGEDINNIYNEMTHLAKTDNKFRKEYEEYFINSPRRMQADILQQMAELDQLKQETREYIVDSVNRETKERLYNEIRKTDEYAVLAATEDNLNKFFKANNCAPNPLDNYRLPIG